jgi:hypothetical protein
MGYVALSSLLNPASGVAATSAWGDQINDNFEHLAGTDGATVATSQTTTSTSYTDLTTTGPAVTLTTGTRVLVTLSSIIFNTGVNNSWMAVAVSGATTLAADDARAIVVTGTTGLSASRTFELTGLTAGSNTFTAKYKVTGGTGTFQNRDIVVIPLT